MISNLEKEKALANSYGTTMRPDHARAPGWCRYELHGWHIWAQIGASIGSNRSWGLARLINEKYEYRCYGYDLKDCFEFACTVQGNLSYFEQGRHKHCISLNA